MADEAVPMVRMCGGTSEEKPADDEVQEYLTAVKAEIERELGFALQELTALKYKSQVVAGRNFFVKAHIGNGKYIHARIYKHFHDGPALTSMQADKTEHEGIEYF